MMQTLELRAVQFFSRPVSREDLVIPTAVLTTKQGRRLDGYLMIQLGEPLLVGTGGGTRVRANYAQPWDSNEGRSVGAVQWVDPYAEVRWPSYALVSFSADVTLTTFDRAVECDILQRMRTFVSFEIFELPELRVMTDQLLGHDGYRYGYWTSDLDFVGNPVPMAGQYLNADRGEPVGPGHASLSGIGFAHAGCVMHSLALVWSQAFSFSNRTNAQVDDKLIRKRAQEIKRHYNSKDELSRAQDSLCQNDVKGCVRSAASAVEAALRFYCAEWGVVFPTASIPFNQKIERVLQDAGRPSYCGADPARMRDLLHLYLSRNKMHEGDCYYRDEALGVDIYCDMSHARRFFHAAEAFTFWLDSLA